MYPIKEEPNFGVYVDEQMKILKKYCNVDTDLIFIESYKSNLKFITTLPTICRAINSGKYDLVHVHYGLTAMFTFLPFTKKVPIILTMHGGDIQIEQGKRIQVFLTKRILRKVTAAITLNERMDAVASQYVDTTIIPCSVNTTFFVPAPDKRVKRNVYKFIFPSARTRLVKDYPLYERTINILKSKYNIDVETHEIKGMSREQVRDLYQTSDLCLMTSISEGSPQVIKEAVACNCPVVSTDVGDVKFLLEGVKDSAVSKKHDAEELAGLCYKSLMGQIHGIPGCERVLQIGMDDESTARKIYAVYKKAVNKK